QVIDAYNKAQKDEQTKTQENQRPTYEDSEMKLYRVSLLQQSGDYPQALTYLDSVEKQILDKLFYRERRAELLIQLGKSNEAEIIYRTLIDINNDNHAYHNGLRKSLGLIANGSG